MLVLNSSFLQPITNALHFTVHTACTVMVLTSLSACTVRKEMKYIAGIPRYCTDWFMTLHELVHAFLIFVLYHELIRVVSRNPRYKQCMVVVVPVLVPREAGRLHPGDGGGGGQE